MKKSLGFLFAIFLCFVRQTHAYGPTGHQIVGAIADERLAGTATGKKVGQLLDGLTLEKAAVIADEIKGWDKKGADDPGIFHYLARPRIDEQLRAFWRANPPTEDRMSSIPSHHWFHYTDVPVLNAEKYADGKTGRSEWDIVHMSRYCIEVLQGIRPENNSRKITKPIAVILLAHYLADIHQPLHVGAEYFDQSGQKVDPDRGKPGLEDQGGNTISLELPGGATHQRTKLHGYWDNNAVDGLFPEVSEALPKEERRAKIDAVEKELVHKMAAQEPTDWRMPVNLSVKDYPEAWANSILPVAREAHERLKFEKVHTEFQEGGAVAAGFAKEKSMPDHISYRDWSTRVVREELHRAGWQLADLLEKTLSSNNNQRESLSASISSEASTPALMSTEQEHSAISQSATVAPTQSPAPVLTPATSSTYGAYPANYKQIITDWLQTQLNDPTSAIIVWQSEPKPADLPRKDGKKLYGYLVIFSVNARNRFGAYTGVQSHGALIRDGEVVKGTGFGY